MKGRSMSKIIIIGGGVSGLTAGIYLSIEGHECEIYEKNRSAGGNLTGWDRSGCHIDNCIHWLTGSKRGTQLNNIWREIGLLDDSVPMYRSKNFFQSVLGNEKLGFSQDAEKTRRDMLSLSPSDKKEIDHFIDTVNCFAAMSSDGSFPGKYLAAATHSVQILRYYGMSLYELAEKFRHPLLKLAMTDFIGGEFSAVSLIAAYAAFVSGNGDVPLAGGAVTAAKRIQKRFEELGGIIHLSSPVDRISCRGGRADGVILADGSFREADTVVCACDPEVTFSKLLPRGYMPQRLKKFCKKMPVFSSIHAAFTVDSNVFSPFGTVIIPSPPLSSRSGARLPVREYSHEPDFAPPGRTLMQCIVFQTEEESREWIELRSDKEKYAIRKKRITDIMSEAICNTFPEFRNSIETVDCWTPATYNRYFGARSGAYMSFIMPPRMSLIPASPVIPGLENVFISSQWLRPPGGLPNAAKAALSLPLYGKKQPAGEKIKTVRI